MKLSNYREIKSSIYNKILEESHNIEEEIDVVKVFENYIKGNVAISHDASIEEQVMSILLEEGILDTMRGDVGRAIGALCLMTVGLSLNPNKASAMPANQVDNAIIAVSGAADNIPEVNPETGEEITNWWKTDDGKIPKVNPETGEEIVTNSIDLTSVKPLSDDNLEKFGKTDKLKSKIEDENYNIFNIPKETKDKTLNGIRSAMLKLQQEAEGIDMPDLSPDRDVFRKILDRAYDLEKMFLKTKSNYFMYSMVVTMVMNASKGTSAGRSSTQNSIYLKSKTEREEMFLLYTVGLSQNEIDNYIANSNIKSRNKAINDLCKKSAKKSSNIKDQWEIFNKIEETLQKTSSARGFGGGAIWMWAPEGISKIDLGNSVPEEQAEKAKEHFCGGTQNYLMQVLKEHYGDNLEVPDRAFNSIQKWHANPAVKETLVFDYQSFIGVPSSITSSIMANVITRGMIAIVKTTSSFSSRVEGGHFGWVVKVVPPKQMSAEDFKNLSSSDQKEARGYVVLFEGNTTDSRALSKNTGFRLVKRPFNKIASASAMHPIFSKSTRTSLVKLMEMSRELREQYTQKAIANWVKKKVQHRKARRKKKKRKIASSSRRANRRG